MPAPTPILLIQNFNRMELTQIEKRLESIERMLLSQKNVLTFEEAASYIGVSKSYLYKLTMNNSVPFYRPRNKMIYMERIQLENWLMQNRIASTDELQAKASTYVALNNGRV